jgi:ABC-2 type transport system permease protein
MKWARLDWESVIALTQKEFGQIRRDPSTFLIVLVLPLLLLFLFGYAVILDNNVNRVGIVMQDNGAQAASLSQSFQSSDTFDTVVAHDIRPMRELLLAGKIRAIVVIPQDFSRSLAKLQPTPVQVITDGSYPNTANIVGAYAQGQITQWFQQESGVLQQAGAQLPPQVQVTPRYWYNPELRSRYFLVPGSIVLTITMIGTLLTSLVVAREWERGTMESLLSTPVTMLEFLLSKLIPYFCLAIVSMVLCVVMAVTVFGVPYRGSIFALFLSTSAFLLPALGQGILISSGLKNQFLASQVALITSFLPTFLLSGFLYEISSMPVPLQALSYISPARYFVPVVQTLFLAGDVWPLILPNIIILCAFGGLFLSLSWLVTRRSLG